MIICKVNISLFGVDIKFLMLQCHYCKTLTFVNVFEKNSHVLTYCVLVLIFQYQDDTMDNLPIKSTTPNDDKEHQEFVEVIFHPSGNHTEDIILARSYRLEVDNDKDLAAKNIPARGAIVIPLSTNLYTGN